MLSTIFKTRKRKGAALVEYALLVGGIALIAAGAVSVFGHKTSDIIGTVAAILPGAHTDDNAPIISGKLIETQLGASGISLDFTGIAGASGVSRLGLNVGGPDGSASIASLVVEANP